MDVKEGEKKLVFADEGGQVVAISALRRSCFSIKTLMNKFGRAAAALN